MIFIVLIVFFLVVCNFFLFFEIFYFNFDFFEKVFCFGEKFYFFKIYIGNYRKRGFFCFIVGFLYNEGLFLVIGL